MPISHSAATELEQLLGSGIAGELISEQVRQGLQALIEAEAATALGADRRKALEILDGAVCAGARAREVAVLLGVGLTTLQRWRRQFAGGGDGTDHRKGTHRNVSHRLSDEGRHGILLTCNELEFAALPPSLIVPVLADRGLFTGSERSFYRVLHAHGQAHRRGRARLPMEPRTVPRLRADGPNQLWSWDISYLPTSVKGIWLYLYLVIDVWSRKVIAWDVESSEDPKLAANLVNRAFLRERITRRRKQPLILHADNGNAMRAATLEVRLEELGVLRSFSRPRGSNDNPYSESLFRTIKYRLDHLRKPFTSKEQACLWVVV